MAKRKKRRSRLRANTQRTKNSQGQSTQEIKQKPVLDSVGASIHKDKKFQVGEAMAARLSVPALPWLFWLVIFLVVSPAIVGPYGQKGGYTPDLHMAAYIQVLGVLLLAVYLFSRSGTRPIELPCAPMPLPMLLFYLWAIISFFWSLNTYEWSRAALNYTGAIVGGLLVLLLVKDVQALHRLLFMMALSGLLIALLGIGQFLFGIDWVQQHIVPAATFSNKNMAGQYGLLTFPLAIIYFFNSKTKFSTWFFALTAALILVFIYYTRARAVWVSALFEIVVLLTFLAYWKFVRKHILLNTKDKKLGLITGIALVLVLSYVTPTMLGTSQAVAKASIGTKGIGPYYAKDGWKVAESVISDIEHTGHIRFRIWTNSIPMLIDHFFAGVGLGNWTVHYPEYQSWVEQDVQLVQNKFHANAHNDYVEFICELGMIGFIFILLILAALVKTVTALLSVKHESSEGFLMFAPILALIGIGVDAAFSFPFKQPVPLLVIVVYLAVLSCAYSFYISQKQYALSVAKPIYRRLPGVVTLILSIALLVFHYNLFQSEIYYRKAAILIQQNGRGSELLRAARKAYEYNPLRTKLQWFEATALLKLGQAEKAIPLLVKVLADYPYSRNTLYNLASAYWTMGRYAETAHYFGQLLSVQKVDHKTLLNYMNVLLQAGQYRKVPEEIDFYIREASTNVKKLEAKSKSFSESIKNLNSADSRRQESRFKKRFSSAKKRLNILENIKRRAQQALEKQSKS